jgi:hypothetical protein
LPGSFFHRVAAAFLARADRCAAVIDLAMATRIPTELREYLAKLGRKGGKKAAESMTAAQRSARAKKAAATRWKKEPGSAR